MIVQPRTSNVFLQVWNCSLTNKCRPQRASSTEMVTSLSDVGATVELDESCPWFIVLLLINAGLPGWGRVVSFPNMNIISAMVGWSVACSCTHKSPIWIHLETSLVEYT